ncbi:Uncharacterised protein [Vibrio cholerae]|uniref:Uncharacterized protein n=1 Tax=Vibrio cholerae TaxID=666 RepID=A0A655ZV06_VIBCL|nr:Uncharacterised protein [Vibrio cholerae]
MTRRQYHVAKINTLNVWANGSRSRVSMQNFCHLSYPLVVRKSLFSLPVKLW